MAEGGRLQPHSPHRPDVRVPGPAWVCGNPLLRDVPEVGGGGIAGLLLPQERFPGSETAPAWPGEQGSYCTGVPGVGVPGGRAWEQPEEVPGGHQGRSPG